MIIKVFYPNYFSYKKVAYTCLAIAEGLSRLGVNISVYGIAAEKGFKHELYTSAFNRLFATIAYRILPNKVIKIIAEKIYLHQLRPGDIAYLWPDVSIDTIKKIKKLGCIVISENINTHTKNAKEILSAEYKQLGLINFNEITDEMIEYENTVHKLSDYIFSPSSQVTLSLKKSGVSENKILESSYGWSKKRQPLTNKNNKIDNDLKVLFIAMLCIRKGFHLLVDIWNKAEINGTLIIAGKIRDNYSKDMTKEFFKREDVTYLGFVDDISELYNICDIFVLPSLEEGDPMVTYEAMAAGLPVIVSPMGAGRGVRDGVDGFVIDPHNITAWVDALQKLSNSKTLYEEMSKNAKERASEYTWDKVAQQRYDLLNSLTDIT